MLRPPREILDYELAGEGASNLGHVGQQLEQALATLAAFDAAIASTGATAADARAELLAEAADRLWVYVVQREAMGLTYHDGVLDLMRVPREVRVRMGPRPRRATPSR